MKYILIFLFFVSGSVFAKCDKNNFDQCKTCDQLSRAIDLSDPDRGDYYRGALWNGLYASYVRNCQEVAEKLLANGATPSLGGAQAAFPIVISRKWPHNNIKINEEWKNILLKHNVKLDLIPDGRKSPYEIFFNDPNYVEYLEIWAELVAESNPKPVDLARNIDRCASEDYLGANKVVLSSCIYTGIDDFDDGISTASDVAGAVISSCEDVLVSASEAITCRFIINENITDAKQQAAMFKVLKNEMRESLVNDQRMELVKTILKKRNAAKKSEK